MLLPEARYGHCMVLLTNGTVFIAGGTKKVGKFMRATNTCWLFHPTTGKYSSCEAMSTPMAKHTCSLFEGKIYVVGTKEDSSKVYDPVLNIWSEGPEFTNNHRTYTGSMKEFQGSLYFREYYSDEDGQDIHKLEASNAWNRAIQMKSKTKGNIFPMTKLVFGQYSPDGSCNI